jgi:hypothetical protein
MHLLFTSVACESNRIKVVAETDDEAADFGRTALMDAIVKLSEQPKSAEAYAAFAGRVRALEPLFNREMAREAELRLSVLAIGPLRAKLELSHEQQMQALATTVWPALLNVPAEPDESVESYVHRLCSSELALSCNNVVPEYWPVILNARVWRSLKSRVDVAYDRCEWCEDDPSFPAIMSDVRDSHLSIELEAQAAQELGKPSAWARAGRHASPLATDLIVSFGDDGHVHVKNRPLIGGDWRQAISDLYESNKILGLHLRPERMIGDLLQVLGDARTAGYSRVALIVREGHFPYRIRQYEISAAIKSYRDLGMQNSDSIQILVQSLDLAASKKAAHKARGKRSGAAGPDR